MFDTLMLWLCWQAGVSGKSRIPGKENGGRLPGEGFPGTAYPASQPLGTRAENALLDGELRQRRPVAKIEFGHQPRAVRLDRFDTQKEPSIVSTSTAA